MNVNRVKKNFTVGVAYWDGQLTESEMGGAMGGNSNAYALFL